MPTDLLLPVALGLTALVVWSIAKRVLKLALYAAVAGAVAWMWYFGGWG